MKKCEIVDYVINKTELSRSQANEAVESVFNAIHDALRNGESVYIRGFATFKTYKTKERKARTLTKGRWSLSLHSRQSSLFLARN